MSAPAPLRHTRPGPRTWTLPAVVALALLSCAAAARVARAPPQGEAIPLRALDEDRRGCEAVSLLQHSMGSISQEVADVAPDGESAPGHASRGAAGASRGGSATPAALDGRGPAVFEASLAPALRGLAVLALAREREEPVGPAAGLQESAANATSRDMMVRNESVKLASDIWNSSVDWVSVREWHPAGVISNLGDGTVRWTDASFMNLNELLVLTAVAYPAFCVALLLMVTILLSTCLATQPEGSKGSPASAGGFIAVGAGDPLYNPPVLPKERLTEASRTLYRMWAFFSCLIPFLLVFVMPVIMMLLARPYPQEVYAALTLLTSAFIFSNGMYMAIFAGGALQRMRLAMASDFREAIQAEACAGSPSVDKVFHWVLVPQFKESVDCLSMVLRSVAASTLARQQIGVVLCLEEREGQAAHDRAAALEARFAGQLREIVVSQHPAGLPNDPPGKASNLAWGFKQLVLHLAQSGSQMEDVILTVADADSEFHEGYFESLTGSYLRADAEQRHLRIWQSPIFHIKNYHRQPAAVVVGTMFTCMQELAALSDPNAVRFPYSTYSLSLHLARRVGGWDADWIAEDYHMGIKCFLLTLGQTSVEPVLLPTVNYTPEGDTWVSTILARWTQAQRHALGFSDLAYYFLMLPLIFSYVGTRESGIQSLRHFWSMTTYGVTLLVRLMNIHVVIGILSTYGLVAAFLKLIMTALFDGSRNVDFLFSRVNSCEQLLMFSSAISTIIVSVLFIVAYGLMGQRIEGESWVWAGAHWARNLLAILVCGPLYYFGLGYAVLRASVLLVMSRSFEYEVAPKPLSTPPFGASAASSSPTSQPASPKRSPVFGVGFAARAS